MSSAGVHGRLHKKGLNLKDLTYSMATFVKKRMKKTMDEWNLTIKKVTLHIGTAEKPAYPPSPVEASGAEWLPLPTYCEPERTQMLEHKRKAG